MNLTPGPLKPKKGRNAGIPWHILAKYQQGGPQKIGPQEGLGTQLVRDLEEFPGYGEPPLLRRIENKLRNTAESKAELFAQDFMATKYDKAKPTSAMTWDALRHTATAMYQAAQMPAALGLTRAGVVNAMGHAHELRVRGPEDETRMDVANNMVGAAIGSLPISLEEKERLLKEAFNAGLVFKLEDEADAKAFAENALREMRLDNNKRRHKGKPSVPMQQTGGTPNDMKKKKKAPTQSQGIIAIPIPPQMQMGGLGDLAGFDLSGLKGVMSGMEGIDFNDYNSVLAAGNKIGGQNFADAVAADDPLKMTGLPEMARAMAVQQKPAWQEGTPEYNAEFDRRVQEQGIDLLPREQRRNAKRDLHRRLQREGRNNQAFGQSIQTVRNTMDASGQAVGLGSLLDLMGGFQFQKGGTRDRSIQGYSDGSPYKSLPYIMIPGNTIDMSNTGMPILAVADSGETRVLPPYSGQHQFPGASQVKEMPAVPKKKKGGKKYRYQQGGPGAIGAQLEVGEVFATPNVDIIDTNATQKHKDMPKDLVTDILGPQDYVFSAMPNFKITRKQAEELSDKVGGVLYEEGKVKDLPKTYGPIDMFKEGEDEVQLSEYVKRIRDSFKVRPDEKEDPFVRKTNAGNKESRIPFLEAAAAVNEMKRGGNSQVGYASGFENRFNDSIWADANPVRKAGVYSAYDSTEAVTEAMLAAQQPQGSGQMPGAMPAMPGQPKEMQLGGILGPISAGFQFLGGLFGGINQNNISRNNYKTIQRALSQDKKDINKLASTQSQFNVASAVPVLGALAAQNPIVDAVKSDTSQLDATVRRMPASLFDVAAARLTANTRPYLNALTSNATNFNQVVAGAAPVFAGNATAMANLGIQEAQSNIQMENQYRAQKQAYQDRDIANEVAARNATRSNSNQLLSGLGATLSGTVGRQGSIETDRQNALRDNQMQLAQAEINRRTQRGEAWNKIFEGAGQGMSTLYADAMYNGIYGTPKTPAAAPPGSVTQAQFQDAANTMAQLTARTPTQLDQMQGWAAPMALPAQNGVYPLTPIQPLPPLAPTIWANNPYAPQPYPQGQAPSSFQNATGYQYVPPTPGMYSTMPAPPPYKKGGKTKSK